MLRLPSFNFIQPDTLGDVVSVLNAEGPACAVLSGGTDLLPKMKRRQIEPQTLVSLDRLAALRKLEGTGETGVVIGARVTLAELEQNQMLCSQYPAVAAAARSISSPPLRNAGTLGGNLCVDTRCTYYDQTHEWRKSIDFCMKKDGHVCWVAPSSPRCWAVASSDLAPVMIALNARVRLISKEGERLIPAAELYRNDGIEFLSKRQDELLTEIHLPPARTDLMLYKKLRRRGAIDFPILGVAVRLRPSNTDAAVIEEGRIALTAIGSYPFEVEAARAVLAGTRLTDEVIEQAAEAAWKRAKPLDNTDLHMSWRKEMVRVYTRRALRELRGVTSVE